jgi:hypothetical protein
MKTHHRPTRPVAATARPRFAAGLLVAGALFAAACSDGTTSPPTSTAPALFSNSKHHDGNGNGNGNGNGSGVAAGFTVLGQAAASCTDGTITGSVGTFQTTPPGAITLVRCPVSGGLHIGDGAAKQAFNAFVAQYDALAPKVGDCDLAHTLASTIPASMTLAPGVYCTAAALTATDVTLTLDARGNANATWVFKIGGAGPLGTGALTGTNFAVLLAGGAQACNVTWWVSQAATISTTTIPGTAFQGNILAGAAITLTRGTLNGNAWAGAKTGVTGVRVGDVTVTGTAVTGCASGRGHGGDGDEDDEDHGNGKDKDKCNQGVGNGPEGCDPGNSNHRHGSNDERGGRPGHPGRRG